MVEGDVRRRAEDDEHARRIELPRVEDVRVGLEVGEVVLLLQAPVADELVAGGAVAGEPLGRNRVRDDDLRRRAAAELVLEPGELVVEGRRARDPEPARRDRQLVRAVREGDVDATPLRPALQRREA